MTEAVISTHFVWALVLGGMAVFFAGAARRFAGRGFDVLAVAMAVVAVSELLGAGASYFHTGPAAFLMKRAGLAVGPVALSLNLHFLLRYCEARGLGLVLRLSYISLGAAALANLLLSLEQLPHLDTMSVAADYSSPSPAFSTFILAVLAVNFGLALFVLYRAYRGGRHHALALLVALALMAPATVADTAGTLLYSQKWFVAEAGCWLYCLVVLASLLSEFQGAEGRLKETTSSLNERTAELEITYAEIDLVYSELFSKEQMAAVGELAAAIAHEVRNPLAIIMNAASGLRRPRIVDADKETLLSIINEESERLNQLVGELLRFARPVAAARGPASLLEICEQAGREPPEGYFIRVFKNEESHLDSVLVDPDLLRLALDNVMANSIQAMPAGGTIDIVVRSGALADGSQAAVVEIRDTGSGMNEEELVNAKKPFFTTKPRGTGLGIPIALRIIEAHGGEMEITSVRREGTTVTIRLPFEADLDRQPNLSGPKHPGARRRRRSRPSSERGFESPSTDPEGSKL